MGPDVLEIQHMHRRRRSPVSFLRDIRGSLLRRVLRIALRPASMIMVDFPPGGSTDLPVEWLENRIARARSEGR